MASSASREMDVESFLNGMKGTLTDAGKEMKKLGKKGKAAGEKAILEHEIASIKGQWGKQAFELAEAADWAALRALTDQYKVQLAGPRAKLHRAMNDLEAIRLGKEPAPPAAAERVATESSAPWFTTDTTRGPQAAAQAGEALGAALGPVFDAFEQKQTKRVPPSELVAAELEVPSPGWLQEVSASVACESRETCETVAEPAAEAELPSGVQQENRGTREAELAAVVAPHGDGVTRVD